MASDTVDALPASHKNLILRAREALFGASEKINFCLLCGIEIKDKDYLLCSLHDAQVV